MAFLCERTLLCRLLCYGSLGEAAWEGPTIITEEEFAKYNFVESLGACALALSLGHSHTRGHYFTPMLHLFSNRFDHYASDCWVVICCFQSSHVLRATRIPDCCVCYVLSLQSLHNGLCAADLQLHKQDASTMEEASGEARALRLRHMHLGEAAWEAAPL